MGDKASSQPHGRIKSAHWLLSRVLGYTHTHTYILIIKYARKYSKRVTFTDYRALMPKQETITNTTLQSYQTTIPDKTQYNNK